MTTTTENRPRTAGTTRAATGRDHSDADGARAGRWRPDREILETTDRGDGILVTRYRWHIEGGTSADGSPMPPSSGVESVIGPVTPLSREVLEDVAGPALDVATGLLAAAAEIEDDAALGRRAREIVRRWATIRVEREIARRTDVQP